MASTRSWGSHRCSGVLSTVKGPRACTREVGGCIATVRMVLRGTEVGGRRGAIEEYLGSRVLSNNGDTALIESLMRFSLADSVAWQLFGDLCDASEPDLLLERLQATGLTEGGDGSDAVAFTIPTAVRALLRDQYMSSAADDAVGISPPPCPMVRWPWWRVARSLAFHHAVAALDWELVGRLWSENIVTMIEENASPSFEALEALPADVLTTHPSMQAFRDIAHIAPADTDAAGRRAIAVAFGESSARLLISHWETMPLGELLIVATGYLIQLRLLSRFQDSAAVGDRVHARASALAASQSVAKSTVAWFHLHRGLTYTLLNDAASAVRSYARAWDLGTGAGVDLIPSQAAANLAFTHGLSGDSALATSG